MIKALITNFNQTFLEPKSIVEDSRRREHILNVILLGLFVFSLLLLLYTGIHLIVSEPLDGDSPAIGNITFVIVISLLILASRLGHTKLASSLTVTFIFLAAISLMLQWSFELPAAQLLCALCIVMSGVLFNTRIALCFTTACSVTLLLLALLQINGILLTNTDWSYRHLVLSDALGYIVLHILIGIVAWLYNREIDSALNEAKLSQNKLAKERDNLETKVKARTNELEKAQLARVIELQRLADFGRFGVALIHEVANPLNAATLNLEQLNSTNYLYIARRARKNLLYLERYLNAARKQLKGEGVVTKFSANSELKQLVKLLSPYAEDENVKLVLKSSGTNVIYGDSVKFDQMIANLIVNAIDSYTDHKLLISKKIVKITVSRIADSLQIAVSDEGKGIDAQNIENIFNPFFTTKQYSVTNKGTGIGLTLAKQYIERDFGGSITVTSDLGQGTTFLINIKQFNSLTKTSR